MGLLDDQVTLCETLDGATAAVACTLVGIFTGLGVAVTETPVTVVPLPGFDGVVGLPESHAGITTTTSTAAAHRWICLRTSMVFNAPRVLVHSISGRRARIAVN